MQIVSFNTFGLPNYMSWRRIADICAEISKLDADVLCFQEIQQKAYIGQLKNHLPSHFHLAYGIEGHIPMGNLVTASKEKPVRTEFNFSPTVGRRSALASRTGIPLRAFC